MPWRRRSCTPIAPMSRLSILTCPDQTAARPDSTSISVDLPAPFGPIRPRISPWGTAMSTLFTAKKPP